ncbi:AbrB/MazE/SpoVT family DNA-binding domain-containing protein [candidate division KSB1 bacterium]|nr:AbrB/MazE/SpoVT family DNA-binding domain-containing protein [candidate division KSB1 bacterium]
METKIQKWGNSLAVRLPKAFAEQTGIENGSDVRIFIKDGNIILVPIKDHETLLNDLLEQINSSNIHDEIDFGMPVGKEQL